MWNRDAAPRPDGSYQPAQIPHPGPSVPSVSASPADDRRVVAWVGKSVIFRGDLVSSEDMTIDGRVEGSIEVRDHHLTIGPNATIEADVVAKQVTVFGKITGSVTAQDKVEIRQGATMEADVLCQALAIQEGAYFCGKVDMSGRRPKTDVTTAQSVAAPAARG